MIRSKAILQSAKGEYCTVQGPHCNGNPDTTVWAHSNRQVHGKGMGIKAHDIFGCYACSSCHDWIDGRVSPGDSYAVADAMSRAMARSILALINKGIITIES